MTGPPPEIEKIIYSWSNDKTNCPSCGRYVGPLELCPYCRAMHRKRPIITIIKYASPILGILGLLLLHQIGQSMGSPQVKIGELGRTSNFAYVTMAGSVCDEPRFYHASGTDDPFAGTMEFCLDDGTGRTRVKTYEDATRRILLEKKIPFPGDKVRVTGNYQSRIHKHSMIVGSPHGIEIEPAPVSADVTSASLAWAQKNDLTQFTRLRVTGWVSFVYNDRDKGKYSAVIHLSGGKQRDERGKKRYLRIELPWSRLEMEGLIPRNAKTWDALPGKGTKVAVSGVIKYMGRGKHPGWRLYPRWAADIEILETPRVKGGDQ
jgi:hypothetical protein